MDCFIISNRCKFSYLSFFNKIVLGRIESYEAGLLLCWHFCKSMNCQDMALH